MNKKGEFRSQVPHVMLHLNPGVARHYGTQVKKLDLLKDKVNLYYTTFYVILIKCLSSGGANGGATKNALY